MAQSYDQASWDEQGSTWVQIVYFKNGKIMQGYSKRVNFDEKADKIALLTNWILRMYKAGYLDKNNEGKTEIEYMEYFRNAMQPELVLRLYYNTYELPDVALQENIQMRTFLKRFYELIELNKTPEFINTKLMVANRAAFENPLDLSVHKFIEPKMLFEYCRNLVIDKKASGGETKSFFQQYLSKYFNQTDVFNNGENMHYWLSQSNHLTEIK